jgi:hypothetical protein
MKGLFSKAIVVIAGVAAFLGISVANVTASVPTSVKEITSKSALYLEHGKSISDSSNTLNGFNDHYSHSSHESHSSHRSHYSGY